MILFLFISCKKENNPPIIADQTFSVKENSTPGLVCATIVATDTDGDVLKFDLINNDEGLPFEIDRNNGNIRIKQNANLDFEKVQQYKFQVKVTDGRESASAIATINIADQLENPNVFDQAFEIQENIVGIHSLGVVKFESKGEREEYSFDIVEGNNSNLFFIGEKSGELFLTEGKSLDFETESKYSLQIKIQNKTNTSYYTIIKAEIIVNDVNEKPVMADQTLSIPENSENDSSIGTLLATDPDKGQQLNFAILQSSPENAVKIDTSNGKLLVSDKSKFDYEKNNKIILSVKVTDNGTIPLSDTAKVIVNVQDVDERPSITTQKLQINENSSSGQVVGTINAKSYFGTLIQYSIISGDGLGKFLIDKNSGIVTVAQSVELNYEYKRSYSLNLKVYEAENSDNYNTAAIIIELNDINEPPTLSPYEFAVHNPVSGSLLCGTVQAKDPDIGQIMSYSIVGGNTDGYFSINTLTGEISLENPLNMADNEEVDYKLIIRANDNGSNSLFAEAEARIKVIKQDIPKTGLIAYYPFNGNAVDESDNSYNGNVVGPTLSTDRNSKANSAYSFDGSNDYIDLGPKVGDGIRSISLWFRLDRNIDATLDRNVALVTREGDYNNYSEFSLAFFPSGLGGTGTPGKLRFFYSVNKNNYYDVQSNSTSWQKDRWYHIVTIIHPTEGMKMYVDNIKQTDTEQYYNATENCQLSTYIGSWGILPNRFFIGKIDDVVFYNRALTDSEINDLFNQ